MNLETKVDLHEADINVLKAQVEILQVEMNEVIPVLKGISEVLLKWTNALNGE